MADRSSSNCTVRSQISYPAGAQKMLLASWANSKQLLPSWLPATCGSQPPSSLQASSSLVLTPGSLPTWLMEITESVMLLLTPTVLSTWLSWLPLGLVTTLPWLTPDCIQIPTRQHLGSAHCPCSLPRQQPWLWLAGFPCHSGCAHSQSVPHCTPGGSHAPEAVPYWHFLSMAPLSWSLWSLPTWFCVWISVPVSTSFMDPHTFSQVIFCLVTGEGKLLGIRDTKLELLLLFPGMFLRPLFSTLFEGPFYF